MSKEIYISSTPHETRLAIVEHDALTEIYYERENEYTLAGSIYNGRVTRVLPGMQSSFVDIGLERDAFLYITDFMEEAGETADFEGHAHSGSNAEDQPRQLSEGNRAESSPNGRRDRNEGRADRGEGRGERNSRGDRGGNREAREPRPEPTDADLFNEAMAGLDPVRSTSDADRSGNRSDNRRGGRDRRPRNDRGDRGGNREGSGSQNIPVRENTYVAEPQILATPAPVETEDLGEGAPGADGSRRWRGRRGRRGNRGERPSATSVDSTQNASGQPEAGFAPDRPATGPVFDSYPQPEESRLDLDASAEPIQTPALNDRSDREARAPRTDRGGRRGRNDRGRNRDSREAQGASQPASQSSAPVERAPQPPRAPRGFAPSASLYKVEGADETHEPEPYGYEAEIPAPAEPVILPGESLSKYRPASETASPAVARPAEPAPVSDFVAAGWDGGFVLPGETLRPRGPVAESTSEAGFRENRDSRGSRDERGRRDSRGGRGGREDRGNRSDREARGPRPGADAAHRNQPAANHDPRPEASEVQQPAAAPEPVQHGVKPAEPTAPTEPTYLTDPDHIPASHLVTPLHSTFVAPPPMPASEPVSLQAAAEPVEYEPTEASASFRIDPVPPSEFRQAAPILETQSFEEEVFEEETLDGRPRENQLAASELHHEAESPVPLETAAFAEPADLAGEPAREPVIAAPQETDPADLHSVSPALHEAFAHSEPATESPEFTTLSATGEMHSEAQPAVAELPAMQEPEPTSPIEHESAVVDTVFEAAQPPHFEPGSGMLEEEVLEEDITEFDEAPQPITLNAHSHADAEQETLEGAADLASMLHDLSIDQITRSEPSVSDEDDDFEEDFLEEDQDFDTELSSDDDEEVDSAELAEDGEAEPALLDEPAHSEYGSGFEGDHNHSETPRAETAGSSDSQRREPRREGRDRNDRTRRDSRDSRDSRNDRNGRSDGRSRDRGFSSPGADRIVTDRDRSSSSSGGRRDSRGGRNSVQATNLPAISDLLKPGQELLCQIAKEPIAKKGARITSHIALPGRFLVFMPTVSHTGVSRKIESGDERRRLKEILLSERGEATGGFIVRTAAAGATEEELRSDLRFLLNLWADIKARSESSKSPALIYHDLNLVERVLRDQVTDNFSAIWVDTESQYEQVLRFLQRFQPSLIRRVKLYTKETPLFEQFGITEEINKALRSKVWLKSGGSIVINQTEALVAIDINTGKFVGKTARLEDTIVKTNLDAIPEIVRQIRLRDLGGIIIIDFIDMDERKNRNKVLAALEEELKADRAPSKVLNFNDFGLIAITRKRVKQSLERTLSTTCAICAGTGMTKSAVTVCNDIYVEMRKMHKHLDRGDVMLRVHPDVVKQLKAPATHWLQEMEEMCGKTILVKSDPSLHPEQFDIH